MIALLAAVGAWAACDDPVEPAAFREAVDRIDRAAEADDTDTQEALVRSLEARLDCITFEVDPSLYARFLLEDALVRHRAGAEWEPWLATSVRSDPRLERNLGAGHPLQRWMPPVVPRDPPTYEVVGDQRVVVDGAVRTRYFELPLDGVHLVQIWRGDALETRLLEAGVGLPSVDPSRVAAFRYVAPHQIRERRARARLVAAGIGGGFAALGLGGIAGGALVHASIFRGTSEDRQRKVVIRDVLYAAGATSLALSATTFGVGWSVRW